MYFDISVITTVYFTKETSHLCITPLHITSQKLYIQVIRLHVYIIYILLCYFIFSNLTDFEISWQFLITLSFGEFESNLYKSV